MYAKIYCYTKKQKCNWNLNESDVYTIYHCICQNIRIIVYLQMIRHVNKIYLIRVSSKSVVALTSDTQVEIRHYGVVLVLEGWTQQHKCVYLKHNLYSNLPSIFAFVEYFITTKLIFYQNLIFRLKIEKTTLINYRNDILCNHFDQCNFG